MEIQIQSIHFDAHEQLLNETTQKLQKLGKLYDSILTCDVVLQKEKDDHQKKFLVKVKLDVPGKHLFASEKAESFERAIERVTDDLKRELKKYKQKQNGFSRAEVLAFCLIHPLYTPKG